MPTAIIPNEVSYFAYGTYGKPDANLKANKKQRRTKSKGEQKVKANKMRTFLRVLMSWVAFLIVVGLGLIIYFESSIEHFWNTIKNLGG